MKSENEGKKGPGRPRIESKLPEGWKEIIIESGRQGKHVTDFLITLGISWQAHYSLMERNKEYYQAVNEYNKYCEQYWYNMAQEHMEENGGAAFNSRLWSLILRNKFPKHWSESSRVDVTTDGQKIESSKPITIEIVRNIQKPNEDGETI